MRYIVFFGLTTAGSTRIDGLGLCHSVSSRTSRNSTAPWLDLITLLL